MPIDENEIKWYKHISKSELDSAIRFFPKNKKIKILEIGGRDGYQAKYISDMGYDIISIDIKPLEPLYFPVKKIDGSKLEFLDKSFDLICTFHVLAHIEDLEQSFKEMRRVLKNDGIVIHIVPTTWWSFLTNLYYYFLLPKIILKSIRKQINSIEKLDEYNNSFLDNNEKLLDISKKQKIRMLFSHPLRNQNPSFLHELYYFSKSFWKKLFQKNGFVVISIKNSDYLYSAYGIFKMKLYNLRKFLAKRNITSSYCFVLKKAKDN